MKRTNPSPLSTVIGLAAVAGSRSMMAPALLSHALKDRRSHQLKRSWLGWMQSPKTATVFKVLTFGELIGDKLPGAPDRIETPGLVGRALSGALVGTTLYVRQGRGAWAGAAWGVLGAVASSYACYYLRQQLDASTSIPDPVWGAVEDLGALVSGRRLLR